MFTLKVQSSAIEKSCSCPHLHFEKEVLTHTYAHKRLPSWYSKKRIRVPWCRVHTCLSHSYLTKKQALLLPYDEDPALINYIASLERIIGLKRILAGSKIFKNRIRIYLYNNNKDISLRKLFSPSRKILIQYSSVLATFYIRPVSYTHLTLPTIYSV